MTQDEIRAHARRIAQVYLEDGMEFCYVYEDDELVDADVAGETLQDIHTAAQHLLMGLAKGIVV